jgi:hypothetical protein
VYIAMGIYADFSRLVQVIAGFEWMYLAALLGLTTTGYLLRYLKWDLFLKKAGIAGSVLSRHWYYFHRNLSHFLFPYIYPDIFISCYAYFLPCLAVEVTVQ